MSSAGAPVRAVLFDYGLTLVHFERPVAAIAAAQSAIAATMRDTGHPPPPLTVLQEAHDSVERAVRAHAESGTLEEINVGDLERRTFADLGLDLDDTLLDTCSALIQEAWFDGVRPYPETRTVLRALRAAGLRIGICSNAAYRPASMHEQLRHVGIANLIDGSVFSGEVGWRKPAPQLFTAALAEVGSDAATTVFVGDSLREDVAGAHAAGMRTVLVQRGGAHAEHAGADPPPDAVVTTLRDLPGVVRDLET